MLGVPSASTGASVQQGACKLLHRKRHASSKASSTDHKLHHRGDILELLDDVLELRPTVFYSVPRLYNRIYDRVMATIRAGNPVTRALFDRAFASKRAALQQGTMSGGRFGPFWDRLVFSKVKARLGGEPVLDSTRCIWHLKQSKPCTQYRGQP